MAATALDPLNFSIRTCRSTAWIEKPRRGALFLGIACVVWWAWSKMLLLASRCCSLLVVAATAASGAVAAAFALRSSSSRDSTLPTKKESWLTSSEPPVRRLDCWGRPPLVDSSQTE